jgi:hypothetical protein
MELISAAIASEPVKQTVIAQPAPNLELVENQPRSSIPARPPQSAPQQHSEEPKRTQLTPLQPPISAAPENLISEPFDHQKRVLFTAAESLALDRIAYDLSVKFKTQVKVSHVVRAMLRPFLTSEAYISAVASFSQPLARPGNANLQEIREFEQAIVAIMESALLKRLELKAA